MRGMLLAAGEVGYAEATVQNALDRAGLARGRFYGYFENKEDCFARACEGAIGDLCERVLAAGRDPDGWPAGYRAALAELLRFVSCEPLAARALLIESQAAGGRAAAAHDGAMARLASAVDSARDQIETHSPPPLTARFLVATVESTVRELLAGDKALTYISLLPELVHLAVLFYFGEDAVREALKGT